MAWDVGKQKKMNIRDYNSIVKELTHNMNDEEARATLAQFLRANIGFTFQFMTGLELLPIQELILRSCLLKDNGLIVAGRGLGKSFMIGVLSLLYPIFHPNNKMVLISANFRGSRRVLEEAEKITKRDNAFLLSQCFSRKLSKQNDQYKWILDNNAEVIALPLSNGNGLRGTRASTVCVDEGLLITEAIQEEIIRPFLTANQNYEEQKKLSELEEELIKMGEMKEEERTIFPKNKYLVFSSASYKFEYLFTMWKNFLDRIETPPGPEDPTYFAMRASYECLPKDSFLDMTQINTAKANGGENSEYFKREYRAIFSNASDGYFNAERMHECTVPIGDLPSTQVIGDKDSRYILAIDPNVAANKNSDFFGMGVFLLMPETRRICQVHTYARAGGTVKEHQAYFAYILKHFNIEFIIYDASGPQFINGFNESVLAKNLNIDLSHIDVDFTDQDKYQENLSLAKQQHNLSHGRIVYAHKFTQFSNRLTNEYLQQAINTKKVWFASRTGSHEGAFKRYIDLGWSEYNDKFKTTLGEPIEGIGDFIDWQDSLIDETKNQTALIEVQTNPMGTLSFDLPRNLKKDTSNKRARRDNYTCLLMGAWGAKCYYDMLFKQETPKITTFDPVLI